MFTEFHRLGYLFALSLLAFLHANAQMKPVPIGELTDSMRLHPKPALVLISTTWCTYCQAQKVQLKKNRDFQSASAYLYFSELDAETKADITFNDTTYRFKPTGVNTGSHELAHVLGNTEGRLAFPTWVLIDERFIIRFKYPGILPPENLATLLDALQGQPAAKRQR